LSEDANNEPENRAATNGMSVNFLLIHNSFIFYSY